MTGSGGDSGPSSSVGHSVPGARGGCGTGGGQATLCVPLPYHVLIERVEDPARYKGWDPLSTRRPRIHPEVEGEVRGGIQSAASSGDARPKGHPRHPEMEALPYAKVPPPPLVSMMTAP